MCRLPHHNPHLAAGGAIPNKLKITIKLEAFKLLKGYLLSLLGFLALIYVTLTTTQHARRSSINIQLLFCLYGTFLLCWINFKTQELITVQFLLYTSKNYTLSYFG